MNLPELTKQSLAGARDQSTNASKDAWLRRLLRFPRAWRELFPELRRNPAARANEFLVKQIGKRKWRRPHSDLGSETAVDTLAAYLETGKRISAIAAASGPVGPENSVTVNRKIPSLDRDRRASY
jgi:hypothetical protein